MKVYKDEEHFFIPFRMIEAGESDLLLVSGDRLNILVKVLSSIVEKLMGDDAAWKRIEGLIPGDGKEQKIENLKFFLNGDSNGLVQHGSNFIKMLQNGIFTQIYQRERELESKLGRFYYEEKMVKNMEKHFRSYKKSVLSKRKPEIFKKLNHPMIFIENENESTKTVSDNEEDSDDDNSGSQSEVSVQSEKVINTTRKSDISVRTNKTQKNVVTLSKSSPEWIANYRAQEAERYRHPLKPWEYILSDGSK